MVQLYTHPRANIRRAIGRTRIKHDHLIGPGNAAQNLLNMCSLIQGDEKTLMGISVAWLFASSFSEVPSDGNITIHCFPPDPTYPSTISRRIYERCTAPRHRHQETSPSIQNTQSKTYCCKKSVKTKVGIGKCARLPGGKFIARTSTAYSVCL